MDGLRRLTEDPLWVSCAIIGGREARPVGGNRAPCRSAWGKIWRCGGNGASFRENCLYSPLLKPPYRPRKSLLKSAAHVASSKPLSQGSGKLSRLAPLAQEHH